jgi:uncharacterized membrane protein SpoIIM required for sporulation
MLGTYTALAWHWGQAGSISNVLWCHGVLEIQALVIAGAAGLVLLRAVVAPGPWSRGHAMALAGRRAWRMFAPIFPLLFAAGLIEGNLSPALEPAARTAVSVTTGALLLAWLLLGGREWTAREPDPATEPAR